MKFIPQRFYYLVALVYSGFIFYVTSIPFDFNIRLLPQAWRRAFTIWTDTHFAVSKGDIIANIVLFALLGYFLKAIFSPAQKWHELKVLGAVAYGFLLSAVIEIFQVCILSRTSSLFDVWVDTLATAGGVLLAWLAQSSYLHRHFIHWFLKTMRENPYLLAAIAFVFFCIFGALFPFDIDPNLTRVKSRFLIGNYKSFFVRDWSNILFWSKAAFTFTLYFLFAFVAFLASVYNKPRNYRWGVPKSIGLALLVALFCEALQVFFTSHVFELFQIEMGFAGGTLGALAARMFEPFVIVRRVSVPEKKLQFASNAGKVFSIAFLFLTLIEWLKPFQFEFRYAFIKDRINNMELIPFQAYTQHFSAWALEDALRKVLLLSVWGFFAAFWLQGRYPHLKKKPVLAGFLVAVFALFLEVLQIFVVGRLFSMTDVVFGFIGGVIGGSFVWLFFEPELREAFSAEPPQSRK